VERANAPLTAEARKGRLYATVGLLLQVTLVFVLIIANRFEL
jgi:hypothetical protein